MVVAIIGMAATLLVVQLGGFSDTARLRAAASHVDRALHLARSEARISGMPRLLEYDPGGALRIMTPRLSARTWTWDDGVVLPGPRGVRVQRLIMHDPVETGGADAPSVRIASTGRVPPHAVIMAVHERCAIVSCASAAHCDVRLALDEPTARTLDHLELELASSAGDGRD